MFGTEKLFIHIPKNGGCTVVFSDALRGKFMRVRDHEQLVSPEYVSGLVSKMTKIENLGPRPTEAQLGIGHARWRDIKPAIRNSMDSFAVIRNPWDRTVSRYFFAKKVIEVEKKYPVGKYKIDSFEHFLEEHDEWIGQDYLHHRAIRYWGPTKDYVTDTKGNLRCDVMRFENLNKDLEKYFNIPKMTRARNVTALNEGTYKDLYTDRTIQLIADWYKEDIDFWGYDFDTGPTRNYCNGGMK